MPSIPYLKKGDIVSLIAPSSPFETALFAKGIKFLERLELIPKFHNSVFNKKGYLAGSDELRKSQLEQALMDRDSRAIFCLRGGYGSMRLLTQSVKLKSRGPKLLMGMSDVSPLLNYLASDPKIASVHGPVIAGSLLHALPQTQRAHLFEQLLNPHTVTLKADADYRVGQSGSAEAPLAGGNLAMIVSTLKTKWEVNFKNKIAYLEDIHEPLYKIDRMLTQLHLSKALSSVKGIVMGDFSDAQGKAHAPEDLLSIVKEYVPKRVPIILDLPAGHHRMKVLLPLGYVVKISASAKKLIVPPIVRR